LTVAGTAETVAGGIGDIFGAVISMSGAGAAAGIPTIAISTDVLITGIAEMAYGISISMTATDNLAGDIKKAQEAAENTDVSKGGSETGKNGTYEKADYHGKTNNAVKNKAPNNGQEALDNSVSIGKNTTRRVGISDGEIVVLDETTKGVFHGHVRSWSELSEPMKAALKKAGMVTKKGKIIK
ncbi:hypothetical protein, partial [Lachnotalea glycerini]|uniref:hypothetical protein n=1 Tax=Lachnotalea glycerini TaxID=1763509 RepID=UPI002E8DDFDD